MGVTRPERADDEFVRICEPHRGVYQGVVVRDGKLVGATLLGNTGWARDAGMTAPGVSGSAVQGGGEAVGDQDPLD